MSESGQGSLERRKRARQDVVAVGPLVASGRARRSLPFLFATVMVFVFAPFGGGEINASELNAAIILASALVLIGAIAPWPRLPVGAQVAIPLGFFAVNVLLRDATGAARSGASVLLLVVLWIALYGARWQLAAGILGIIAAYALPLFIFPSERYPDTVLEIRRAITSLMLIGLTAWSVQRVVQEHRQSRKELATALDREHDVVSQLRDLDRLKSRFVAMASHELRTPLTSVAGFSSTLIDRWDTLSDAERREFAQIIDDQSKRLHRLVDNLLVLTRIQSGSVHVRPRVIPVREAINGVVEILGATEIEVVCDEDVEAYVDFEHFQQILINYVTNARKYGELPICIKARKSDPQWTDIRVCDSGRGVPTEFIPRLFREFERAPSIERMGLEGTGLGLSIVAGLAKAQGGDVWYERNRPKGAVFVVRLPVASTNGNGAGPTIQ